MQFEKDELGNYIGYHWEGGETFEFAGAVNLSMDTLNNDRALFISNTPGAGWGDAHSRLLKVVFSVNKPYPTFTYLRDKSVNAYHILLGFKDGDGKTTLTRHYIREGSHLAGLVRQGFNLFMLDDPKEDLPEAFITEPKKWVIAIEEM